MCLIGYLLVWECLEGNNLIFILVIFPERALLIYSVREIEADYQLLLL